MALLRPLVPDASGSPKAIAAPNMIDPAVLPVTSSDTPVRVAAGVTFNVPANAQKFFHVGLEVDGVLQVDGFLIGV